MFVSVMEGGNLHHPVNPSSALSTKVLATLRSNVLMMVMMVMMMMMMTTTTTTTMTTTTMTRTRDRERVVKKQVSVFYGVLLPCY